MYFIPRLHSLVFIFESLLTENYNVLFLQSAWRLYGSQSVQMSLILFNSLIYNRILTLQLTAQNGPVYIHLCIISLGTMQFNSTNSEPFTEGFDSLKKLRRLDGLSDRRFLVSTSTSCLEHNGSYLRMT